MNEATDAVGPAVRGSKNDTGDPNFAKDLMDTELPNKPAPDIETVDTMLTRPTTELSLPTRAEHRTDMLSLSTAAP
jgi:hypothetical protein